jgi:hypothetical protein
MHDISSDLKGRAERLKAEIGAENARFEHLLQQLRAKQEVSLQPLRAQLRLAHKLLEFTAWNDRLRAELAARIAAAEAAENFIRKSLGEDGETKRPLPLVVALNGRGAEPPSSGATQIDCKPA